MHKSDLNTHFIENDEPHNRHLKKQNYAGQHRPVRAAVQHRPEVAEGREEVDGRVLPRAERGPDRDRHQRVLQVGKSCFLFGLATSQH